MQSLMSAMEHSSDAEKQVVLAKIEEMQMRDTLRMYNSLVERCFSECVNAFRSKTLSGPEEKCVTTCASKYLKHSGRVGQRFGEISMNDAPPGQGG